MPAKLKTKLRQNQFYCVKCRARKTVATGDICVEEYKNHRARDGYTPALKGYCSKCDTSLTKFIKYKDVNRLTTKFGRC